MPQASTTHTSKRVYRCSFCGKAQTEVKTLVAGPGVFICDECVQLCRQVVEKKRKPATREMPNSLLPDNAPTEALLKTLAGYNGAFGRIDAAMQEQWLLGFLSGIGFMALGELDPLHGVPSEAVSGWVDTYCRGHPSETLETAARAFIQEHPR